MEKGNVYDLYLKYPISLGGVKRNNLRLVSSAIGTTFVNNFGTNVIGQHQNVLEEASANDIIHGLKIQDMEFLIFTDIENNTIVLATEYIRNYETSGNNYKFEVKNVNINEKMIILKELKKLGFTVTEV